MRTAVIVGGGIGGLATANALLRQGWSVRVLEQADAIEAVGSGITLWSNALRALQAIGVPAPGARPRSAAGGIRDWRGHRLLGTHHAAEAADRAGTMVTVHRAELLEALLDGVPPECRTLGARVREVRPTGAGAVVEYDRGALEADLVVGADGVHSAVRAALWPTARPPRYSGRTVWRMVLPKPPGLLDGDASWTEFWGPGAAFGRFDMPDERLYCYATATVPAGQRARDGELAEVRRRFAGWCEPIRTVLAALRGEQVTRNDVYYLPGLSTFVRPGVALLGDAAHAMTPNRGQGGCMALEDAAVLGVVTSAGVDLTAALSRYDALRRRRGQWMARQSRQAELITHVGPAPLRALRDTFARTMPRGMFNAVLAKPFSWDG